MKRLLLAVSLLGAMGAQASVSMLDVVTSIQKTASVDGILMNKDGSVTVSDITVKRGDIVYPIGINYTDKDYNYACKLLGFESSVTGDNLNNYTEVSKRPMAFLDENGKFSKVSSHAYQISKVTCLKGSLKTVVLFDKADNEDRSAKITNISYLRGDQTYPIGINYTDKDYGYTCKLLGYEESLSGDGLNSYAEVAKQSMVFLDSNGKYVKTASHAYKITKLTCFSGAEPSLIVLVGGTRYMRVIP